MPSELSLPVAHVSDTAYMVAAYRMLESQRADALFHDDLAPTLLGGLAATYLHDAKHRDFGAWMLAVRTRIIDTWIEEKIAEGADLVLNLAAGLDTRPYRLANLSPKVRWLEVDFAPVIDHKNKLLAGQKASCQLERVAADLADPRALDRLHELLAERGSQAVVLTEGLLIYLEQATVEALTSFLHAQPSVKWWITEFASPEFLSWAVKLWKDDAKPGATAANKVQFRFLPPDSRQFFQSRGWKVAGFRGYREESLALGRLPPPSIGGGREVLDLAASSGYALLERA